MKGEQKISAIKKYRPILPKVSNENEFKANLNLNNNMVDIKPKIKSETIIKSPKKRGRKKKIVSKKQQVYISQFLGSHITSDIGVIHKLRLQ